MIVYYEGKQDKFDHNWDVYKTQISSIVKFPNDFELLTNNIEDISNEFGNNSIKVGKGLHKNDVTLYHLFLNIDYRVTS